jgi:hypothetical protein
MTIEEGNKVKHIVDSIKLCSDTKDRLIKLHKEEKHEEVTRIALEMADELKRKYESDLYKYPSPNGG